jgi:Peptidase_C39 like family
MNSEITAAVQRQLQRLAAYSSPVAPNLSTPSVYFSQRDNSVQPDRTCNSSSNAMYTDWLMRATGRSGLGGDEGYLKRVLSTGDSTEHWVQTKVIKDYGFTTVWQTDADSPFVLALLDAGFPVVVNILHRGSESSPRGGHVILLVGQTDSELIAQDPYGTLVSNYSDRNGRLSRFSKRSFGNRWQGGYRILGKPEASEN